MITTRKKGRVAAVSAVIVGLVLGTALTASADTGRTSTPFPDPDILGTLTITKLADPAGETLTPGNGLPVVPAAPGELLDGVNFEIQRLKLDLTSESGWKLLRQLSANGVPADIVDYIDLPWGERQDTTGRTAPGVALFEELSVGAYLVTEVEPFRPDIISSSHPFIVTVPITHALELNRWEYDVHVYPKNADTTTTKTVNDAAAVIVGDSVSFDVSMMVPRDVESLRFEDVLDSRLEFTDEPGDFVWLVDGQEFDAVTPGDYWVEPDAAGKQVLIVEFDKSFLRDHVGKHVGFRFHAAVTGIEGSGGEPAGVITNEATYFVNTVNGRVEGKSNPVVTEWGVIKVTKTSAIDPNLGLEDAWFCLATSEEAARQGVCATDSLRTVKMYPNGPGVLEFIVRKPDFANGVIVGDDDEGFFDYWLIETKAPKGFELLAEPIQVPSDGWAGGQGPTVPVENYPSNGGFPLPEIGGNRAVLPILAAVVAAGGVVFLIRSRRQQEQKA